MRVYETNNGNFSVMGDEYPVDHYKVFRTGYYDIYLHPEYPPIYYQKKWVGKGRYYLGVPGLANAQIVRSPKGNLVTQAAGVWGAVVDATEEGEFPVRICARETLRRGKPVFEVIND